MAWVFFHAAFSPVHDLPVRWVLQEAESEWQGWVDSLHPVTKPLYLCHRHFLESRMVMGLGDTPAMKCLPCKLEDRSLDLQHSHEILGVVA